MSKSDVFNNQTRLIQKPELRKLVIDTLEAAPDYFYIMPASSTGKYHPAYTLGDGGLVRHTKAAVKIAECLLSLEMYEALAHKSDEIYAALILHDSVKKGMTGNQYTTTEHPLDAAKLLIDTAKKVNFADMETVEFIAGMIRSHMGQWNTNRDGKEVLPKPVTKEQKFVHQCDYLASRKFLTVEELN